MKAYADTNFFTRYYLRIERCEEAKALADEASSGGAGPVGITWLHRAEFVNALQLHVYLGRVAGHPRVTPEQAAVALATFREDVAAGAFFFAAQLSQTALEDQVEELALRHTATHGFRTYDLLHVASALLLGCDTFWSFDERILKLATLEGLKSSARQRP